MRPNNGGSNMEGRWLSVDEIAAYLEVTTDSVYRWVTQRKMPGHSTGRLPFSSFFQSDLMDTMNDIGSALLTTIVQTRQS